MTRRLLEGRTHDGYPARHFGPVTTDAERRRFIAEMVAKYGLELPGTKRIVANEYADAE